MNSLPVPVRAPSLERVPAPASSEPSACLTPHPNYTDQQPQTGQAQATPLVMGGRAGSRCWCWVQLPLALPGRTACPWARGSPEVWAVGEAPCPLLGEGLGNAAPGRVGSPSTLQGPRGSWRKTC